VVSWRGGRTGQVCYLRREVQLDRPASELADCGRPHASRGAALLEQKGPFRGRGGLGGQGLSLLIDLRVSHGTACGALAVARLARQPAGCWLAC